MSKIIKQAMIVLFLSVAIILTYNELYQYNNGKEELDFNLRPELKLSTLSEELAESIAVIEKKAAMLKKGRFTLDILSLTGEKNNYIQANTPLVLQTYYQGSEELKQNITTVPNDFIGLTFNELSQIAGEWQVKTYKPGKGLVLYRSLDQLSPDDKKNMHLGIKNGRVAIFYGESGDKFLKKLTEIKVDDLPYSEKMNLEKGIVVKSQEELLSILEGLISIED